MVYYLNSCITLLTDISITFFNADYRRLPACLPCRQAGTQMVANWMLNNRFSQISVAHSPLLRYVLCALCF